MPIIGLSDIETVQNTPLPIPVWGRVRKGAEKPERGAGKNLDYFRFDFEGNAWIENAFNQVVSNGNPSELRIQFLSDDPDSVFDSYWRLYGGNNALKRKCNGETVLRCLTDEGYSDEPKPCMCDHDKRGKENGFCSERGMLYFTIPALCEFVGELGQFIMSTGSPIEIRDIATTLYHVREAAGRLTQINFTLQRTERAFDLTKPDGTPVQYKQHMVELIPPLQAVLGTVINNPALPIQEAPKQLTDGEKETVKKSLSPDKNRRVGQAPPKAPKTAKNGNKGLTQAQMREFSALINRHMDGNLEELYLNMLSLADEDIVKPPTFPTVYKEFLANCINVEDAVNKWIRLVAATEFSFRSHGMVIRPQNNTRAYDFYFVKTPVTIYDSKVIAPLFPENWIQNAQEFFESNGREALSVKFADEFPNWENWHYPKFKLEEKTHKGTGALYYVGTPVIPEMVDESDESEGDISDMDDIPF